MSIYEVKMTTSFSTTPSKDDKLPLPPESSSDLKHTEEYTHKTRDNESGFKHVEECLHETVENGSCNICGLDISSSGSYLSYHEDYSASHQRSTPVSTLGFDKDLADKNIPTEIKAWVLQKAGMAPKRIHRLGCRQRILFAYVYLGYMQFNYTFEPEKVAELLGIDKSQWGGALQLVSGISSTQLPQAKVDTITAPLHIVSPLTYLDSVLTTLKMEAHKAKVIELATKALEKDPLLYEEQPKRMAVAFLKYYLDTNNMSVPKFHTYYSMTAVSIKACVGKIQAALRV